MVTINCNLDREELAPLYQTYSRPTRKLIIWLFCLLLSTSVMAHDPGLSKVTIKITEHQTSAHIIYARGDLEQLVLLDQAQNGVSTENEFSLIENDLLELINSTMVLSWDGEKLRPSQTSVALIANDAVEFRLIYAFVPGKNLNIKSSVFDKLALGHRQFITIADAQGQIANGILSSRNQTIEVNVSSPALWSVFLNYVDEGVWHIWIGYDHILFIISLLLPAALVCSRKTWSPRNDLPCVVVDIMKVVSAFTLAHSITLALTIFEVISLPAILVESIIAFSVIVAALNNIFVWSRKKLWFLAGIFGLIHGMGFASVLSDLGLPDNTKAMALIAFNLGVELGQLAIVLIILPGIYGLRKLRFYNPVFVTTGSWAIAFIATVWLIERLSGFGFDQWDWATVPYMVRPELRILAIFSEL